MGFKIPSVVSIAGSDSSGGAGIQADLKTIEALGLFAQTAITALTAQNTLGVSGVLDVPSEFVVQQIDAVFEDIRPGAVKIGMVSSALNVVAIAESLRAHAAENIVVDPVMVITPNIPEAEVLWGRGRATKRDMEAAAGELSERFGVAVLVKGGHGISDADDVLAERGFTCWLPGERIENDNTHGTGCTLSSAIACGLAKGFTVFEACEYAKRYISGALAAQLDLGKGSGPLDHMWEYRGR